MLYSIIYSVDVVRNMSIVPFAPCPRKRWRQTEGDDQYDYDYLGEEYKNGKHRKWAAVLNQEQFDRFVVDLDMEAQDVETGGSLGGLLPDGQCYLGCLPAISFDMQNSEVIDGHAYVTPFPEVEQTWQGRSEEAAYRVFDRIRRAVINRYSSEGQYRARLKGHKKHIERTRPIQAVVR